VRARASAASRRKRFLRKANHLKRNVVAGVRACNEAASQQRSRKVAKGSHPKDHSKIEEVERLPTFLRKPEHPKRKDGAGVRVHIEASGLPGI
jgi:hypothetical protein